MNWQLRCYQPSHATRLVTDQTQVSLVQHINCFGFHLQPVAAKDRPKQVDRRCSCYISKPATRQLDYETQSESRLLAQRCLKRISCVSLRFHTNIGWLHFKRFCMRSSFCMRSLALLTRQWNKRDPCWRILLVSLSFIKQDVLVNILGSTWCPAVANDLLNVELCRCIRLLPGITEIPYQWCYS